MPRRRPVLKNIAILASGGLAERFLGAVYRVILARAAGAEALGLIQFVLPVLRLASIVGTLGLPQSLTRTVAALLARGRRDDARAVLNWALRSILTVSSIIAAVLLLFAPCWGTLFPDKRAVPLLRWLAPLLICDCLSWILQANLQGRNRMWPVTLAGLLGQSCKLAITLWAMARSSRDPGAMAVTALIAMTAGETTALLFLAVLTAFSGDIGPARTKPPRRSLLLNSLPLMGDGLVFAVAGAADMVVIPRRLISAGHAPDTIAGLMGHAWGMALPTLHLPMVAVWPIAAATLPVMAESLARSDLAGLRKRVSITYLCVAGIAAAAAGVFLLFPAPIMKALYACPEASPYLRAFALAVFPIYLASIGGTFLAALGMTGLLFRQSLACASVRIFLLYILTGIPKVGINGAIFAITAGNGLLALANAWGVWRRLWPGKKPLNSSRVLWKDSAR